VGPTDGLPITELARWFDSPFWWRGEPVTDYLREFGGELVPVSSADITPAALTEVDTEQLDSFTDDVLSTLGKSPLVLRRPPATIMALVCALAARLPGTLEPFSVSTYETSDTALLYDIVGTTEVVAAVPAHYVSDQARRARRTVLSDHEQDHHVTDIALSLAGESTRSPLNRLVRFLDIFGQARTGQPINATLLPEVLLKPPGAIALLSLDAGRAALQRALVDRRTPVWEALATSADRLPHHLLAELADGVVRSLAEPENHGAVADVFARCAAMPEEFTSSLAKALLVAAKSVPGLLARLDTGVTLDLLRRQAQRDPSIGPVVSTLLNTTPGRCLSIADVETLPAPWRAKALANRLLAIPGEPEPVMTRIDRYPELTSSFVHALPSPEHLRVALQQSDARLASRIALRAADELPDDEASRQLKAILDRLAPTERPAFLSSVLTHRKPATSWDDITAMVVGDAIDDQLRRRQGHPTDDSDLLRILGMVDGRRCRSWLQILDKMTQPDTALPTLWDIGEPHHRDAAATLLLVRFLNSSPPLKTVNNFTRQLQNVYTSTEEAVAMLLMQACLSCSPTDSPSKLPFLLAIVYRVENRKLELHRRQLKDRDLQHAVQQVAAETGPHELATISCHVAALSRPVRRWWKLIR